MCGYFCIGFIDHMFKGKTLSEYKNFFSPNDFKKNDDTKKMESYCLKCKKYAKNINLQVSSTSNGKLMILSKCAICGSKKSKFINKQEASGLVLKDH